MTTTPPNDPVWLRQARAARLPKTVTPLMRAAYVRALEEEKTYIPEIWHEITIEHNAIQTAWSESSEKKRWITGNLITVGIGASVCVASWSAFSFGPSGVQTSPTDAFLNTLYTAVGVTALALAISHLRHKALFRLHTARYRTERLRAELRDAITDASGSTPDGADSSQHEDRTDLKLPGVWSVTQKRLDFYHSLATEQADKSFRDNRLATALGFTVLLGATVVAGVTASLGGAIAAGVIAAVGGALTAYLSKTFMRTHERASDQLQSYFGQPLAVSRYLAAERLLDQLHGDAKASAVRDIIRFIAMTPTPPTAEPNSQDEQMQQPRADS